MKMAIHWPETSKFCGVFSLNVGVYVYTVINMMFNGWILYFVWGLFLRFTRIDFDSIYAEKDDDSSEVGHWRTILYIVLMSIAVVITVYKLVETLSLIVLLCGVWLKKPAVVKSHLYFSVINWIIGLLIAFILSFFIDLPGRIILILLILMYAYMILNIRSLYLQMSGKSRVVVTPQDILNAAELEANTRQCSNIQEVQSTAPHCETCCCNQNAATSTPNETFEYQVLDSNASTAENTPTTENRILDQPRGILNNNRPRFLNLRLDPVSDNRIQMELRRRYSTQSPDLVDQAGNSEGVTNDQSVIDDKKDTVQEKDNMVVVYDENQLNVGVSPLFEENPITRPHDSRYPNSVEASTSRY